MKTTVTHSYRGRKILPLPVSSRAVRPDDGQLRWYIQRIHDTGIPFSWEHSAKAHTLAEARAAIDEMEFHRA